MYWNFHEENIVIVTSVIFRTQTASAVFHQQYSFTTRIVKNTITYLLKTTRKKCTSSTIKCYTFKRQNWCFIFQHIDDIVQIHLNIYPIYQQVSEFLMIMIMIKGVILIVPSQEKNAGCCPWNLRTADCTSASDANFCPPVIFFIGPKRCQSLARLKA